MKIEINRLQIGISVCFEAVCVKGLVLIVQYFIGKAVVHVIFMRKVKKLDSNKIQIVWTSVKQVTKFDQSLCPMSTLNYKSTLWHGSSVCDLSLLDIEVKIITIKCTLNYKSTIIYCNCCDSPSKIRNNYLCLRIYRLPCLHTYWQNFYICVVSVSTGST